MVWVSQADQRASALFQLFKSAASVFVWEKTYMMVTLSSSLKAWLGTRFKGRWVSLLQDSWARHFKSTLTLLRIKESMLFGLHFVVTVKNRRVEQKKKVQKFLEGFSKNLWLLAAAELLTVEAQMLLPPGGPAGCLCCTERSQGCSGRWGGRYKPRRSARSGHRTARAGARPPGEPWVTPGQSSRSSCLL